MICWLSCKMRDLVVAFILLATILCANAQQCRYVTMPVCDGQSESTGSNVFGAKGDKGASGFPGKAGRPGDRGESGQIGQKGSKGDTGGVDELQRSLTEQLAAIRTTLNTLLLPATCASSPVIGYQVMRSGEYAYCDGGWTVFQRRYDGSVDFQRSWDLYKSGFGNMSTEFWLGLEKIYQLTRNRGCRLRVDLWDFENDHAFAEYSSFSIEGEEDLYRLHVEGYSGTAGNGLNSDHAHNGMAFTTIDRDNDVRAQNNCANDRFGISGGWWFRDCQHAKLNALWGESNGAYHNNIWYQWKGERAALKASQMKLRCD